MITSEATTLADELETLLNGRHGEILGSRRDVIKRAVASLRSPAQPCDARLRAALRKIADLPPFLSLNAEVIVTTWREMRSLAEEALAASTVTVPSQKSAPIFKASHNTDERDPLVMAGWVGADTVPAPDAQGDGVREDVHRVLDENDGYWQSCSGCYSTNEGYPTAPQSETFKCELGNGCGECGGIGAIWVQRDWSDPCGDPTCCGSLSTPPASSPTERTPVAWQFREKIKGPDWFWQHCDIPQSNPECEYRALYAAPPVAGATDAVVNFEHTLLLSMALTMQGLARLGKMTNNEVLAITNSAFARIDERRALSTTSKPARGDREALIEECAKVADAEHERQLRIIEAARDDEALTDTAREKIRHIAHAKSISACRISSDIRRAAPTPAPGGDSK